MRIITILTSLLFASSILHAKQVTPTHTRAPQSHQLDTCYLGKLDGLNYGVMLSKDKHLDQVLYILEGFDPFDETDYHSVYNHWRKSPIIDKLYTQGYDIITIDFKDNNDDVLINAAHIKALIKHVNQKKKGHKPGILAGESMGGVIGRVALAELEHVNYEHQIKLFIALDSPFKGANIPLGIQHLLSDLAKLKRPLINKAFYQQTGYSIEEINKTLNSQAAQQLIRFHIADSSQKHFQDFQNYLSKIGYPQQTRNIALVNGSNTGKNYPFKPATLYFALEKGWAPLLKLEAKCYMTSCNDSEQMVSIVKDYNLWHIRRPRRSYKRVYSVGQQCFDNAPGGYLHQLDFSTEGIANFCFVPSASAIDLKEELYLSPKGLYYFNTDSISSSYLIQTGASPFDAIYSNPRNDKHAKIYLIPKLEELITKEMLSKKQH